VECFGGGSTDRREQMPAKKKATKKSKAKKMSRSCKKTCR
jgi:hypothetical protein